MNLLKGTVNRTHVDGDYYHDHDLGSDCHGRKPHRARLRGLMLRVLVHRVICGDGFVADSPNWSWTSSVGVDYLSWISPIRGN